MASRRRCKRTALLSLGAALTFFMFIPGYAYAYIDPATTSYIIQLLVGLIISLSVAFGVLFGRIRLLLATARARISAFWARLASKVQPIDLVLSNDGGDGGKDARYREQPKRRIGGAIDRKAWDKERRRNKSKELFNLRIWLFEETRGFKQRLLLALMVTAALSVTFLICSPLDLFIANRQYIPYSLSSIILPVLAAGVIGFLIMLIILLISRGRVFTCLVSLFFGGLFMLYIQGKFLNINMGLLTGDAVDWGQYTLWAIINTLICILIVSVPFTVHALNKKLWQSSVVFMSGLMVVVQLVSLLTVATSTGVFSEDSSSSQHADMVLTDEALSEVSASENIIVLVLDRTDGSMMDEIVDDDPDFFEGRLDGFTCFTNYNSYYNLTFPSVCNLLTGARYDYSSSPRDYMDQAYANSDFFKDLKDAGWTNYVYTEKSFAYNDAEALKDDVANVEAGTSVIDGLTAVKKLYKLTLYSYAPHVAKARFWTMTSEFYEGVDYGSMYVMDDHIYYKDLKTEGLKFGEAEKRFAFIHLNGSHAPFTWSRDMQEVSSEQGTELLQARAAYTIAFEYLDQLKKMGLYEDATIIVTADHGSKYTLETLPNSTALFVKPSGSAGSTLVFNDAPVTFDNFRPTILQAAGVDYRKYGSTYFEVLEKDDVVRTLTFRTVPRGQGDEWLYEYEIRGDIRDGRNWTLVRDFKFEYASEIGH